MGPLGVEGWGTVRRVQTEGRSFRVLGFGPLLFALGAQGLILLLAVFVVVVRPGLRDEPAFVAKKTIYLPQRELDHRVSVAEFQEVAQPPAMLDRLTVDSLRPNNLPALPSLPSLEALEGSELLMETGGLLGQAGLLGGLGEMGSSSSEISFFGLKARAERIVICFDISRSVKNKVERAGSSMNAVKAEALRLLEQLNANTLFGFIQFSRNYDVYREYLVAATQPNKRTAAAWLESAFRTDGASGSGWHQDEPNGIQSVLRAAFRLDPAPDMIIILSDGSFQRTPRKGGSANVPWSAVADDLRDLQAGLPDPAQIHFVGFQVQADDRVEMRRISRRYGGSLREVDDARK